MFKSANVSFHNRRNNITIKLIAYAFTRLCIEDIACHVFPFLSFDHT